MAYLGDTQHITITMSQTRAYHDGQDWLYTQNVASCLCFFCPGISEHPSLKLVEGKCFGPSRLVSQQSFH